MTTLCLGGLDRLDSDVARARPPEFDRFSPSFDFAHQAARGILGRIEARPEYGSRRSARARTDPLEQLRLSVAFGEQRRQPAGRRVNARTNSAHRAVNAVPMPREAAAGIRTTVDMAQVIPHFTA